jgi:ribosomal protein S18 acetylase RimI-like enzyme
VFPEHRGSGIGRALLRHLAELTLARDGGRLAWAVLDWNAAAIGFYQSVGAVPMDDWTTFRVTGSALHRLAGGAAG